MAANGAAVQATSASSSIAAILADAPRVVKVPWCPL